MTKAERMTQAQAALWLERYQSQFVAGTLHECEYGHLEDSTNDGGACLDEVLGRFPELA